MTTSNRPKRVVVVDADNPLVEIHGEFFWREDHDALVAAARGVAFREGYAAGQIDAARQAVPPTVTLRRRRSFVNRLWRMVFALAALLMLLVVLVTVGGQLLAQY